MNGSRKIVSHCDLWRCNARECFDINFIAGKFLTESIFSGITLEKRMREELMSNVEFKVFEVRERSKESFVNDVKLFL